MTTYHSSASPPRPAAQIFTGRPPGEPRALRFFVKGTSLQLQVWRALVRIASGSVATYGDVASALGRPGASRAVGSAVDDNPVA